tara:strand:+ start:739 stop:3225 length:2487 start_codon:yes stop_codon:yes gene_type:complete
MNYFPKSILCLLFLVFLSNLNSQTITVIDSETETTIPSVLLFNQNKSVSKLTDFEGKISIDIFNKNDSITLTHISYKEEKFSFSELKKLSTIKLTMKSRGLDEVVLSVARNKQNLKSLSKKVSIINKKTIELENPKTSAELLYHAGGIHIQKSQAGGGSPVIRGFEANRVLLVVDGVRMNNAIYRSGHLQNAITIDANALERTEIIYGPSSVGYGSDALGGVVHFYTKTPRINNSKFFNYYKSVSYNVNNKTKINNYSLELSKRKWASYTSYTKSYFGDIVMGKNRNHGFKGWGLVEYYSKNNGNNFYENQSINNNPNIQKNSSYKQRDFTQKFNFITGENSNLILNFQYSNSSNISRFDKLSEITSDGNLKYAQWYYGPQKRLLSSIKLNLAGGKIYDSASLIASFQKINESRNSRKFGSLNLKSQDEDLRVFSINTDFSKNLNEINSLAYGFELTNNKLNSTAKNFELVTENNKVIERSYSKGLSRYPSDGSEYGSVAAYFEFRKKISSQTNLSIGTRYSLVDISASWDKNFLMDNNLYSFFRQFEDLNFTNSAITTSIGLSQITNNFNKISINLSSGFRAPNIDDVGKIRENSGILTVPNAKLKPENAYTIDLGFNRYDKAFSYNFNLYFTLLNRTIGRDLFYDYDDTTTQNPITVLYDNEEVITMGNYNLGNSSVYGFNFDANYSFDEYFYLIGNLTYTKGDIVYNDFPMPSIPPLFGSLKLRFQKNNFNIQLKYKFSQSKSADNYSFGGEDSLDETPFVYEDGEIKYLGMPEWGIFQLSSLFRVSKKMKAQLLLDNIFDIHYREFASGISSPGRSLNLMLIFD